MNTIKLFFFSNSTPHVEYREGSYRLAVSALHWIRWWLRRIFEFFEGWRSSWRKSLLRIFPCRAPIAQRLGDLGILGWPLRVLWWGGPWKPGPCTALLLELAVRHLRYRTLGPCSARSRNWCTLWVAAIRILLIPLRLSSGCFASKLANIVWCSLVATQVYETTFEEPPGQVK